MHVGVTATPLAAYLPPPPCQHDSHLWSTHPVLSGSPALNTLPESGYLIFSASLQRRCYYHTHFTEEETEAQRDRDLPNAHCQ